MKEIPTDFVVNLQSITDKDIEAWADIFCPNPNNFDDTSTYVEGLLRGAKAMRDGEIKHIEK